jgi:hypothetical protein
MSLCSENAFALYSGGSGRVPSVSRDRHYRALGERLLQQPGVLGTRLVMQVTLCRRNVARPSRLASDNTSVTGSSMKAAA